MYTILNNQKKVVNSNKNPIQTNEASKMYLFEALFFKKNLDYIYLHTQKQFEITYKSCKFAEMTDNLRFVKIHELFLNCLTQTTVGLKFICLINFNILSCSNYFFFLESILIASKPVILIFSFFFGLIDFLYKHFSKKRAFLIIEKFPHEKKQLLITSLLKNLKKFDIFFFLKKYFSAKKIINKFQLFVSKEQSASEFESEIAFRLGKFSLKNIKFEFSISHFMESVIKIEKNNKLKFSFLIEMLFVCANFSKNFRISSLIKEYRTLPNTLNFTFLKFLHRDVKKTNIISMGKIFGKKNNSDTNQIKKILIDMFFEYSLIKKLQKI
jgi:hypothetical protein